MELKEETMLVIKRIHWTSNLYHQRERYQGKEVKVLKILKRFRNGDVGGWFVIKLNGRRAKIKIRRVTLSPPE